MAAGKVTILNKALLKVLDGTIDLAASPLNAVLTTKDQALSASFTGTSGNALYDDLTDETTGTGYTAGGQPLTGLSLSQSSGVVTLTADPVEWNALTATMKYLVICLADGTGDPTDILAIADLEQDEAEGRVSTGGQFVINWASAMLTFQRGV